MSHVRKERVQEALLATYLWYGMGFHTANYLELFHITAASLQSAIIRNHFGYAVQKLQYIFLTGFETANTAKDCYKTIEFTTDTARECHNYSIKNDDTCELGKRQQQFQVRLAIVAIGKIPLRIDSEHFLATIVIDDTSEMECCKSVNEDLCNIVCLCFSNC